MLARCSRSQSALVHGQLPIYMVGRSYFFTPTPTTQTTTNEEQLSLTTPVQVAELSSSTNSSVSAEELHCQPAGLKKPGLAAKQSYDALSNQEIKVLMIGDGGTGKTALIKQFISKEFSWAHNSTYTLEFRSKAIHYKDSFYTLNFWDRAGDRSLLDCRDNDNEEFYKDAQAALVVYDLTNLPSTLPNAMRWKERIDSYVCKKPGESIPMFLIGNKCDYDQHECSHDGSAFAELHGFKEHFRASAKLRVGIDRALEKVVREVLKDYPRLPKICNRPKDMISHCTNNTQLL